MQHEPGRLLSHAKRPVPLRAFHGVRVEVTPAMIAEYTKH